MLDIELTDMISVLFVMLAVTVSILVTVKSLKSYRESKQALTLIIAIASFLIALAMIFLTLEKAFLSILGIENLGLLFGATATVISACAMVSFDLFAFKMAFTKRIAIYTAIASLVAAVYVIHWLIDPTKHVAAGEIQFLDPYGLGFQFTPFLSYLTMIPLASLPIFILFYYAKKVRKESSIKSKRAALLGLGGVMLATAYIVELVGIEEVITTGFRSLFVVSAFLFYYALFKLKEKE
ncbi:MAG: hypothetical protein HWN65_13985 [Candidatus Helarchaeota archaeon]|nr:hypothetical protein [Candidatus Helarchaeota archaeon]